jgi:hypothetical protein
VIQGDVGLDIVSPAQIQDHNVSPDDGYTTTGSSGFSFSEMQINQTMVTQGHFGFMNATAQEWIPHSDIGQVVESLMHNISIRLMALRIPGSSTSKEISTSSTSASEITCTQSTMENVYLYRPMVLWVPYATGMVCTLFSVVVGLHALYCNSLKGSTGFKTILAATRNSDPNFVAAVGGEKIHGRVRLRFVDYEVDGTTPKRTFEVVPFICGALVDEESEL